MTNVWHHAPGIDEDVAAIFDPFGNAVHTALTFPVLGEDVLITGAGPIGCMAAAVVRHAGARHVVVTEPNPYRRELARSMGATRRRRPARARRSRDVQRELGMTEGFDVGLEMSGNRAGAARRCSTTWPTAARIAMLGIPTQEIAIDWNHVVFNMLTIKGIYGREMYETWYKMTVMLQSGLDISPGDHAPLRATTSSRRRSRSPRSGDVRQGHPRLDGDLTMYGATFQDDLDDAARRDPRRPASTSTSS